MKDTLTIKAQQNDDGSYHFNVIFVPAYAESGTTLRTFDNQDKAIKSFRKIAVALDMISEARASVCQFSKIAG